MSGSDFSAAGREMDWVRRRLARLGVRDADLDDVTQEVFVAVHRRWDDFDRTRPLRPWLLGFAYRMAADYRKHSVSRRPSEPLDPQHASEDPSPSQVIHDASRRALLHDALERPDDAQRAILRRVRLGPRSVPGGGAHPGLPPA